MAHIIRANDLVLDQLDHLKILHSRINNYRYRNGLALDDDITIIYSDSIELEASVEQHLYEINESIYELKSMAKEIWD